MRLVSLIIAAALVASGCAAPQPTNSQAPPSNTPVVNKPRAAKVGDWWEVKQNPGNPFPCSRWEFQGVKDGMHVVSCGDYLAYHRDEDYNWVRLTDRSGKLLAQSTPFWPERSFPLWVGKEWRVRATGFRVPNDRWTSDVRVRVSALEDIQVSAGTFKAFRIELQDYWRASAGNSGVYRATYWYAQDAQVLLKGVGSDPKWDFELMAWQYEP